MVTFSATFLNKSFKVPVTILNNIGIDKYSNTNWFLVELSIFTKGKDYEKNPMKSFYEVIAIIYDSIVKKENVPLNGIISSEKEEIILNELYLVEINFGDLDSNSSDEVVVTFTFRCKEVIKKELCS